jgi:uncharacterized DUF497 family protein
VNFEWDDRKAEANYLKHGIRFTEAAKVFLDPCHLESLDLREDYGEERFQTIGVVSGRWLLVAYTERGEIIRIISARRATGRERRLYEDAL